MRCVYYFLLFLFSCNLAPRYEKPDMALAATWRTSTDENSSTVNILWWEQLNDPVLNDLIHTALLYNRDLQVAIWNVGAYYAQYEIVRSPLFPQLDLKGGAQKERLPPIANFLPQGTSPINPNFDYFFNFSYEIDLWGEVRNATKAAKLQYLAEIENRKTVVLALVSAVAQAYIHLRQLDLEMQIALETLETREESLQIAKYRFEGGLTSKIEVDQAASVYEQAVAEVKNLERRIPQQENLISVLVGKIPSSVDRGKQLYDLTLPETIPSGVPLDILTQRPDIAKAENILKAANANIGVARAAFFPQVNLSALFGGNTLQLKTLFNKTSQGWEIGGNFLQQIFTGFKLTGQLNLTKAEKQKALYEYEQTVLTALKEVEDALIGHKKSKEIVQAYRQEVKALRDYLKLSWLRYYEGQTQYLTVLDAERRLFAAQLELAKAQGDEFETWVAIYKALGGGWVVEADKMACKE